MLLNALKKPWFAALLCAALAFAAFSPVLRAGFVWDDGIIQSYQLPFFKSVGDAFDPPPQLTEWSKIYYRPVVVLSYMAEDRLTESLAAGGTGREDPRRATLPHAMSLLFHALATGAVVLFSARLLRPFQWGWVGGLAAGLFFGLLPTHAETACWISGRSDSLATLFTVTGILAVLSAEERGSKSLLALAGASFLLALLSKEVALAGFALLPLALAMAGEPAARRGWKGWTAAMAPLTAAFALWLALRLWAGSTLTSGASGQWGDLLPAVLKAVSFYLSSAVLFWKVVPYPAELPASLWAAAWLSVGLLAVVACAVAWIRGQRHPALCLLWFFAALAPSLWVLASNSASLPVAQRYLYLPGVALALAVGWGASLLAEGRMRKAGAAAFSLAMAVFFALSINAASIWRDDVSFWSAVVEDETAARHAMPWVNLGAAHLYKGKYEEADRYLLRALNPGVPTPKALLAMAYTNLGVSRMERAFGLKRGGKIAEAEALAADAQRYMDSAVAQKLADWTLYKNNAQCLLLRADISKAKTGAYDPALLEAARQQLQKASMFSPGNGEILEQFAVYSRYAEEAEKR